MNKDQYSDAMKLWHLKSQTRRRLHYEAVLAGLPDSEQHDVVELVKEVHAKVGTTARRGFGKTAAKELVTSLGMDETFIKCMDRVYGKQELRR